MFFVRSLVLIAIMFFVGGCKALLEDAVYFCTPTGPDGELHTFTMSRIGSGGLQNCVVTYGAGVQGCCPYEVDIPDNYRKCKIRGPNTVTFTSRMWTYPGAPTGPTTNSDFLGGFAEVDNLSHLQQFEPTNVEVVNAPIVLGIQSGLGSSVTSGGVGIWAIPTQVDPTFMGTTVYFDEDQTQGIWHVRLYPDEEPPVSHFPDEEIFVCPSDVKLNLTLTSYAVP